MLMWHVTLRMESYGQKARCFVMHLNSVRKAVLRMAKDIANREQIATEGALFHDPQPRATSFP